MYCGCFLWNAAKGDIGTCFHNLILWEDVIVIHSFQAWRNQEKNAINFAEYFLTWNSGLLRTCKTERMPEQLANQRRYLVPCETIGCFIMQREGWISDIFLYPPRRFQGLKRESFTCATDTLSLGNGLSLKGYNSLSGKHTKAALRNNIWDKGLYPTQQRATQISKANLSTSATQKSLLRPGDHQEQHETQHETRWFVECPCTAMSSPGGLGQITICQPV